MNIRAATIGAVLLIGAGISFAIGHYFPRPSKWPVVAWMAMSSTVLLTASWAAVQTIRDLRGIQEDGRDGAMLVYARAHLRSDVMNLVAFASIFVLGVGALFFPTAAIYREIATDALVFMLWVLMWNALFSITLRRRMEVAQRRGRE